MRGASCVTPFLKITRHGSRLTFDVNRCDTRADLSRCMQNCRSALRSERERGVGEWKKGGTEDGTLPAMRRHHVPK